MNAKTDIDLTAKAMKFKLWMFNLKSILVSSYYGDDSFNMLFKDDMNFTWHMSTNHNALILFKACNDDERLWLNELSKRKNAANLGERFFICLYNKNDYAFAFNMILHKAQQHNIINLCTASYDDSLNKMINEKHRFFLATDTPESTIIQYELNHCTTKDEDA